MTVRTPLAVVAVFAAGVLAGCGGGKAPQVSLDDVEEDLQELIAQREDWYPARMVGAVDCPQTAERSEGTTADCTVQVEGLPVTFRVVQTNDRGGIEAERRQAFLSTEKADAFVRGEFDDIVTVDCGDSEFFVRRPGTEFSCKVTATDGTDAEVFIEVLDAFGNIKVVRHT
ncbi:MAG TPA: DUF4333 domain-containing protein [Acidimicrobiia bacterium]|nr:DUF4333 domain-containing protein [Acidimicrobiia bacterium]